MTNQADFWGPFPLCTLGTTGLRITPCSVGCAPLGNMPETVTYEVGEEQALETKCLRLGMVATSWKITA